MKLAATRKEQQKRSSRENNTSAEKALAILLAFTPYNNELGVTEIAQLLGQHKSTTSRLIKLLVATGFLQQNPLTRKYMLGRSAMKLGTATTRALDSRLLAIAHPCLTELSQQTGESVALEMISGTNIILAQHVQGPSHIRFNFQLGEQVPLNVAAGAKVLLAYADDDFRQICLQQPFRRFTDHTITSMEQYQQLLKEIRLSGVAYDRGERYEDTNAMAVPILGPEGLPTAAVVLAGPAFRLTNAYLAKALISLRQTAEKIARQLF